MYYGFCVYILTFEQELQQTVLIILDRMDYMQFLFSSLYLLTFFFSMKNYFQEKGRIILKVSNSTFLFLHSGALVH